MNKEEISILEAELVRIERVKDSFVISTYANLDRSTLELHRKDTKLEESKFDYPNSETRDIEPQT